MQIVNLQSICLFIKLGFLLFLLLLTDLILKNDGITCVLFLGEGKDQETLISLAETVKKAGLKAALYSGRVTEEIEDCLWNTFDYIKAGPYIEEFGPLNKETTNQRLFKIKKEKDIFKKQDITFKFWRKNGEVY